MKRFEKLPLVCIAIFALLALTAGRAAAQQKKPNIVCMLVDNLGYGELGVYGGGILRGAPTPRIDKLASEGMRLLNFNVEAQCTPSRSALMTGRFSIRSGTYEVPIGGAPDGLTLWEVTIAELLSAQGYATGMWGKWHLGSAEDRFPTHQGFDEWYGIPRTYDEAMWPSLNETKSMWPSVGDKQGWNVKEVHPEHIYEALKGELARDIGVLDVDNRRTMEAEITKRAVEFIKRNANTGKPFYAYVSFSLVHMPTLPNLEFAGKTGNGDWADCLAEMDYRTGQILDAIKEAGIEDNTLVVFTSDNGPEATHPDGGGRFAIPGLFDMHAHTATPIHLQTARDVSRMEAWIAHGVTSVRDMGSDIATLKAWSDHRTAFGAPVPRVFSYGSMIEEEPFMWGGSIFAASAEQARDLVRLEKQAGVVGVKSYFTLSWPLHRAVAAEALKQGLPVAAHGLVREEIVRGVLIGHADEEHMVPVDVYYDDLLQLLKATGTHWTPTLALAFSVIPEGSPLRRAMQAQLKRAY